MNNTPMLKYDARVRARALRKGLISSEELAQHIASLPDLESASDLAEIPQPCFVLPTSDASTSEQPGSSLNVASPVPAVVPAVVSTPAVAPHSYTGSAPQGAVAPPNPSPGIPANPWATAAQVAPAPAPAAPPAVVVAPAPVEAPAVVVAPAPVEASAVVAAPEPVEAPAVVVAPAPVEASAVVAAPEPVEAPAVVVAPAPVEAPAVVAAPEPPAAVVAPPEAQPSPSASDVELPATVDSTVSTQPQESLSAAAPAPQPSVDVRSDDELPEPPPGLIIQDPSRDSSSGESQ